MSTNKKAIIEKENKANALTWLLVIVLLGCTLLLVFGGLNKSEPEQVEPKTTTDVVDDLPDKNYK